MQLEICNLGGCWNLCLVGCVKMKDWDLVGLTVNFYCWQYCKRRLRYFFMLWNAADFYESTKLQYLRIWP